MSSDEKTEAPYDVEQGTGGTSDPSAKFREIHPSEEEIEEIDHDRERRLDPENRPENAEVDNTQRTFDPARGEFTDSDEPATEQSSTE